MATAATMDLRDAEHAGNMAAKPSSPDQTRQGSVGTVDTDDDLEETFDLDMGVEAVAQLLVAKAAELVQLQRTHDEYVKSSCEYERELEIEVDRYEKKTQQLEAAALLLERDKSDLRDSVSGTKEELQSSHRREHMLQTQLEEMKWKIQRLEQVNDELETAARIAQATIEDVQHKSETLLEQNVFLQHEKEELLKQLSSIIIAEVHPAMIGPGGQVSVSRSASARYSRKSSSHVTEPPVAPVQQENARKGKKRRGRRPEVLETCLHLTCRKCRANLPHAHNGGSDELGPVAAFFERLRVFLFGPERER
ncbi:Nuclear distribution protein nudE 1 [Phytophthora cinnamomi]|uniref:Nuclear distribution protein nudE 1 n=1 Tax=Phytophthora cinnamomi TaxID=4785 RepID=UPI00355A0D1B|nr:Nuclear distribution protein nudE 1 [Phytophthora cinnamomi]